jgi:hypothetical protein
MKDAPHSADTLLFDHDGEISPAKAEEMLGFVQGLADAGRIPRSAFRVFVELLQNIRLHGGAQGGISIVRGCDCITVRTRNTVPDSVAQEVLRKVSDANRHAENLANVMRAIRARPLPEGAQGAGLGLYELRRLACRDVEACIVPEINGNSGLVITVTLKHKSTP